MQISAVAHHADGLRFAGSGQVFQNTLFEMLDEAELFAGFEWDELKKLAQFCRGSELPMKVDWTTTRCRL